MLDYSRRATAEFRILDICVPFFLSYRATEIMIFLPEPFRAAFLTIVFMQKYLDSSENFIE